MSDFDHVSDHVPLQSVAALTAAQVLSAVLAECSAELAVRVLLREYSEGLVAPVTRGGTSRVNHVTLRTLAQHSQLIGQLLIGQSDVEAILVSDTCHPGAGLRVTPRVTPQLTPRS